MSKLTLVQPWLRTRTTTSRGAAPGAVGWRPCQTVPSGTCMASVRPRKYDGFSRAPAAAAGTRRAHTCHQHARDRRAPAATTVAAASDPPYFRSPALGRDAAARARGGAALQGLRRELVAGVADQLRVHVLAATAVQDHARRALGVCQVLVAPLAQRGDGGVEVAALLRQVVLAAPARAGLALLAQREAAGGDEPVQAVAEHGARHPEPVLHLGEAPD